MQSARAESEYADKDWFGILMVVGKSTNKRRRYIRQMSVLLFYGI